MHRATFILGVLVCAAGAVLIATHGVVLGINVPEAVGFPCSGGGNQTFCPGFSGFSIGGVVLLAGLPMVVRGLTAPDPAQMMKGMGMMGGMGSDGGTGGGIPPAVVAQMLAAQRAQASVPASGAPVAPAGSRFCPACGQANAPTAGFCNRCGKPMPPPT